MQEKKCDQSFEKNCHITYRPMVGIIEKLKSLKPSSLQMFEEKVRVCDEGLKKVCDEKTIGRGEEICKTHYETTCETRFEI